MGARLHLYSASMQSHEPWGVGGTAPQPPRASPSPLAHVTGLALGYLSQSAQISALLLKVGRKHLPQNNANIWDRAQLQKKKKIMETHFYPVFELLNYIRQYKPFTI